MVTTTAEEGTALDLAARSSSEVVAMEQMPQDAAAAPAAGEPAADSGADWAAPSWDDVVRDHGARVYRLAYRLTGNQHDAEDLTQEVFVRVFRSLSQYTPGSFEGWLHRITTNLFLDQVRRKARIRFDGLPDDAADRIPSREVGPSQLLDDRSYDADVQDALDALHPDFRVAVVLCDVEGMTYEEISDLLGIKLGTVRSRIHRGRAALRQALAHRTPRTAMRFPLGHESAGGTA